MSVRVAWISAKGRLEGPTTPRRMSSRQARNAVTASAR